MITVVLVEDQTLVREGIRSLLALADDIEVVGEAADGLDALPLIAATTPDVVLLDLRMPRMRPRHPPSSGLTRPRCWSSRPSMTTTPSSTRSGPALVAICSRT